MWSLKNKKKMSLKKRSDLRVRVSPDPSLSLFLKETVFCSLGLEPELFKYKCEVSSTKCYLQW